MKYYLIIAAMFASVGSCVPAYADPVGDLVYKLLFPKVEKKPIPKVETPNIKQKVKNKEKRKNKGIRNQKVEVEKVPTPSCLEVNVGASMPCATIIENAYRYKQYTKKQKKIMNACLTFEQRKGIAACFPKKKR